VYLTLTKRCIASTSAGLAGVLMLCSFAASARGGEIVPERETLPKRETVIAQAQTPPAGTQPSAQAAPATRHPPDGRAPGVIELMNQVEDLQAEINRLRGQLEVLSAGRALLYLRGTC